MNINLSKLLQLRLNIFLYLTLGWGTARMYIFMLGKLYFFFNRAEKKRIKTAISNVIVKSNPEIDINTMTKNVLRGILAHYYEKFFIAFETPKNAGIFLKKYIIADNLKILEEKLAKGNGVIIITGHYGAIEYIPTLLAVNKYPVSMIAKFKTEKLKKMIFYRAEQYGIHMIDAANTGNVIRDAINELRKNRILVTECDEIEEWRPSEKEKTAFLGKETALDRTINIIQKRTGAEIIFGIIHRYNMNKYKLIMYTHEDMLQILHAIKPSSSGETVLKFLERCIYCHPEQWYQWKNYTKIKTLPASNAKDGNQTSLPLLKPAFGKI